MGDPARAAGTAPPDRGRPRRPWPHRDRYARRPRLPRLANQRDVAVVTGGSSGIGRAIARELAGRGFRCVLIARREDALRAVAEELDGEYELCDVTDRDRVEAVAAAIRERHPRIRLLVNCAGIPGRKSFLELEPERVERVLHTNYLGGVWCLRAFLPALEASGRADVVNIVSVAGTVAFAPSGPYSASKHAQLAFSRATAAELRGRGIRVHTVCPGFVETEGFPQRTALRSRFFRGAVIQPEAVARHVLRSLERGTSETFVPRWYRLFALAQALAPGVVVRFGARSGYRRAAQR